MAQLFPQRFLSLPLLFLLPTIVSSVLGQQIYDTRFEGVTWDNENWILKTTTLDQGHYQSRMSLANGYLGINVAAVGPFFEVDTPVDGDLISGWPLFNRRQTFATISGFWDSQPTTNGSNFPWLYQYGGESVISGVPHWAGLTVEASNGLILNASVDASQISNFSSAMNFKSGVLSWDYTWTPGGDSPSLAVSYTMFVSKLDVNKAAVQLSLTASDNTNVTVTDVLEGDCAVRTDFVDKGSNADNATIWSAVRPNGIANVTAYIYSTLLAGNTSTTQLVEDSSLIGANQSSIAQAVQVNVAAGSPTILTKYIGGASTDAFADPQTVARDASAAAAAAGFDSLLQSHTAEWASILTQDSVDDYSFENGTLPSDPYIVELQITSVTNPYQLLQNTVGSNAIAAAGNNSMLNVNSISVGGLGSDSYAGLIFWDADIWQSSGLVVAFPQAASAGANYRARLFPQAQQNIDMAFSSSQNESGKFSGAAAVFPWTSGRFGNCTGTGPCFDYEYHINGDIGLELYNYYVVTGDAETFQADYFPVYDAIATFYSELITLNESTGLYSLTNATDPDEYANNVDNPGYTMALIKTHLETTNTFRELFGMQENSLAANRSTDLDIPVNDEANLILEYTTMNGSISVKQADIVLIDDFLNYPNEYSLSDLDYYAGKQSENGPGMTYGVFSIVANAYSPSGCSAYTYDIYSSYPYVRAPWFQYSEQLIDDYTLNGGTHPAYPFLTGMGGANRVAIFGYLGLRLRLDAINVDPSLPPQIPRLEYRTFYWQGHPVNATSNATHTTMQRIPGRALPSANAAYLNASIPVTIGSNSTAAAYQLDASGEAIVITNRDIGSVKTWPGNIAQCLPVASEDDFEPGQFPFAANDGAVSTKWQPTQANITSSVTVDLGAEAQGQLVAGFRFDWAQAPPRGYSVAFSNTTAGEQGQGVVNATSSDSVEVSDPYDAATAGLIQPYASNTTNVTLSTPVYAGRYATLSIWGNQASGNDGVGASVAEFAVIVWSNNTGNDTSSGSGSGSGSQTSEGSRFSAGSQGVLVTVVAIVMSLL
ncbi:family 65 glycoside hydrolase [Cryphonectria parasitica EP155]|uniref:alpha,alpha-trehalase n=1 Tax=Cryphonectria parasitica (strain ATCC 38755 / EP155) TaxID=660469 RepID=A0A9P4XSS3_CRYP1|nr:family 65 glycoside hydrolase [Cryphonectria parasitica EP155]KAF3760121.1 family 65 glycoside hydrolase [Cryphonectria parasitica EP155]